MTLPSIAERAGARTLLLQGVERWSAADCAHLLATLESGPPDATRQRLIIGLDESTVDEPGAPALLRERLAFSLPLDGIRPVDLRLLADDLEAIYAARERFEAVETPIELLDGIVAASIALGVGSSRADTLALITARAHAAWRGASCVDEEDAQVAVRLVLLPRARQLPAEAQQSSQQDEQPKNDIDDEDREGDDHEREPDNDAEGVDGLEDRLIEAATADLPPGLLDMLRSQAGRPGKTREQGRRANAQRRKAQWGRPVGHIAGDPRRDGPLHLLATIEKAAPWQPVRRRLMTARVNSTSAARRLLLLPSDIRVTRFKRQAPSLTIFAVDASGSAAMQRLGEAKGAVEFLLSECYARREQVALVAFRGTGAELLLPPTRALARARRMLAQLPGGGATPLASGIEKAHMLALSARQAGQSTLIVLLTDGRANIDRDGSAGRKQAGEDAMSAARRLASEGITAIVVDTSSVPSTKAAELANVMRARYLPLPNAGAREIAGAIVLGGRSAA